MALNINLLPLLRTIASHSGRALTFGVQRPLFSGHQMARVANVDDAKEVVDQTDVFRALGFARVESLDVSAYEGAEHIFDLNETSSPVHLIGAYDAVFTGGTLEHVFHVSHALQHAARFVRPGGTLIHLGPSNNWINHGFYQLCPTLLLDFLAANDWVINESLLIDTITRDPNHWRIKPATHKVKAEGIRQLHYVTARKTDGATSDRIPTQRSYKAKHDGDVATPTQSNKFTPYDLIDGMRA